MSQPPRVAIITGASSGIGAALARRLASSGFKVGLIARRLDRPAGTQSLAASPPSLRPMSAFVKKLEPIDELAARLGPVDLLIANAGVGHLNVNPTNVEQIKVISGKLAGRYIASFLEAVLPAMLDRHSGHLAAISSVATFKGMPGESAYCASKAGLVLSWKACDWQLRGTGIAVTTINPGFVKRDYRRPPFPHARPSARNRRSRPSHMPVCCKRIERYSAFPGKPPGCCAWPVSCRTPSSPAWCRSFPASDRKSRVFLNQSGDRA